MKIRVDDYQAGFLAFRKTLKISHKNHYSTFPTGGILELKCYFGIL